MGTRPKPSSRSRTESQRSRVRPTAGSVGAGGEGLAVAGPGPENDQARLAASRGVTPSRGGSRCAEAGQVGPGDDGGDEVGGQDPTDGCVRR